MSISAFYRKAIPLALALLLLSAAGLSAVDSDFGLTLQSSSTLTQEDTAKNADFDQLVSASLWFELSRGLARSGRASLAGQILSEFSDERAFLFNPDYLRLFGWFPGILGARSILELTAGRFRFADPSEYILNHSADGLKLRIMYPSFRFELSGAYTGLLLNPKSDIRMSSLDWSEKDDESKHFFGPRRAIATAVISFLDTDAFTDLSIYAAGQFDMRAGEVGTRIDTQYLGISRSMRRGRNLYSTVFFNAELGQIRNPEEDTRLVAGMLAGWGLKYIREDLLGSYLEFRLLAAPPDIAADLVGGIDVGVVGYLPVSQPALGVNVSPLMSSLGLLELKYSMRPLIASGNPVAARLQADLAARAYFRTWPVGLNWIKTDPHSDSIVIGSEIGGGLQWRIFSDLGIGFRTTVFLPAKAPFGAAALDMEPIWNLRLDVSVSL